LSQDPFRPLRGQYQSLPFTDIDPRREALFQAYERLLRERLEALETGREDRWHRDYSSLAAYEASVAPNRQRWLDFLTGWDEPRCELQPRVEHLADYPTCRVERVWLTVRPGIEMDCLLLTPPGARKEAAIVCQHGMNGTPEEACGLAEGREDSGYNRCGLRLAEEGFVVILPHEVGGYGTLQGNANHLPGKPVESRYAARNYLHRLAAIQGLNLMGLDLYHVSRAIDYLQTLDSVDPGRIGFYGLSQGGQSALWLPAADTRLQASVCAAFFNHRLPKYAVTGGDNYVSYLDAAEEDRFYWGQMLEFSDWEIVSLTCPRAFMVEAGQEDKAAYWPLVLEEFARVKAVYERLGITERAEICVHEGGHINRAIESLDFLKRWVRDHPSTEV
jgi:dienelactone hydrolase